MEWQGIESAPKDGTVILGWRFYPVAIMWTGDHEWAWEAVQLDGYSKLASNAFIEGDIALTHWMPLPEPPK